MTELYAFVSNNQMPAFFLALIAAWVTVSIASQPFRFFNRWMRSRNIAARGWPPAHLDADGDFKPEPETEATP